MPNSPSCVRIEPVTLVSWRTKTSRALRVIRSARSFSLFTGTARIEGQATVSQIASASA
ncbi:hypothetical protein [Mangrovicoccus ximenensis]|uniref:hypothetical protein n=1 Tax=Mangrovicoccus ximenensis TaxID=1911570 RepID=UPI0013749C9F|nr:hypothetical protein [Mangrovicoccus ximenensis]